MSGLVLPGSSVPSNLRLRESVKVKMVDSDMFDICNRIKEISHKLFIVELEEGDSHCFAIMERTDRGTEDLVMRVKELDGRVLEKCRYMLSVPLEKRLDAIEKQEARDAESEKDDALEKLYQDMGEEMYRELDRCNFINSRGKSYAKRGVVRPDLIKPRRRYVREDLR